MPGRNSCTACTQKVAKSLVMATRALVRLMLGWATATAIGAAREYKPYGFGTARMLAD